MEPKYLAEEVIVQPNHPLTFGDWIVFTKYTDQIQVSGFSKMSWESKGTHPTPPKIPGISRPYDRGLVRDHGG